MGSFWADRNLRGPLALLVQLGFCASWVKICASLRKSAYCNYILWVQWTTNLYTAKMYLPCRLLDEVTAIKSDPHALKLYCLRLERVRGKGRRAVLLQGYMLLYLMPQEPVLYKTWYTCIINSWDSVGEKSWPSGLLMLRYFMFMTWCPIWTLDYHCLANWLMRLNAAVLVHSEITCYENSFMVILITCSSRFSEKMAHWYELMLKDKSFWTRVRRCPECTDVI